MKRTNGLKAVILAGGIGSRPFGLVDGASPMSYPMADGRPLLTHILQSLKDNGIRDVAVTARSADDAELGGETPGPRSPLRHGAWKSSSGPT